MSFLFFFFFALLWFSQSSDHPKKEIGKFDYKQKAKSSKIYASFYIVGYMLKFRTYHIQYDDFFLLFKNLVNIGLLLFSSNGFV